MSGCQVLPQFARQGPQQILTRPSLVAGLQNLRQVPQSRSGPTPRQMLGEIAAAMAIVVYMIAVIAIIGWMFGH